MNARAFILAMRQRGVFFFVRGGRLGWYAPSQLAPEDVAQARALKTDLIALVADAALEAGCAGADPEEAAYLREERAGIMEHQGGMARLEAELRVGINRQMEDSA